MSPPEHRAWLQVALEHPALASVRAPGRRLLESASMFPTVAEIDAVLSPLAGVRFVTQVPRARRRGGSAVPPVEGRYDGWITLRGEVPTRTGSVHDLLNALVWAVFPQSKRVLHARQLRAQQRRSPDGVPRPTRDREQDVLTLLDEGGVVLATRRAAAASRALAEADHAVLRGLLDEGAGVAVGHVFGHALTEHVVLRRAGVPRATVVVLAVEVPGDLRAVDEALRSRMEDEACFLAPDPWPAVSLDLLVGEGQGYGM